MIKFVLPFATTFLDTAYNCPHLCSLCKHNCNNTFLTETRCEKGERENNATVKECSSFKYGA